MREKEQRNTWRGSEWLSVGEEQRCMNGGVTGRAGEANGGQMEYEELACDGSCPGLILSLFFWLTGWEKREVRATHSALCQI